MRQTHVPHITLVSSTYHIIGSMYVSQFHSVQKKIPQTGHQQYPCLLVWDPKKKQKTLIGETW